MSDAPSPGPDLDALFAQFDALSEAVLGVQARLTALYARLGQGPDAALEREAAVLRAERDDTMVRWAHVAMAWRRAGGRIVLEDPPGPEEASGLETEDVDAEDFTLNGVPALEIPGDSVEEVLDLSILQDVVLGPSWTHSAPVDPGFDVESVQQIVSRLGPPRQDTDREALLAEARALHHELVHIGNWETLPRAIQRALVGLLTARMRRLQDDSPPDVRTLLQLQLGKDFTRLTAFSSEHRPGWVTGLSRAHGPETGSWHSDAEFWWTTLRRELGGFVFEAERAALNPEVALEELGAVIAAGADDDVVRRGATRALNAGVSPEDTRLCRLLVGRLSALEGDKGFKRLRRAVRQAEVNGRPPAPHPEDDDDSPLPDAWPFFGRTRGRTAVMVGGEVREQRRVQIEQAFGFRHLEWVSGYDIRTIQSLAERIHGGGVEFVLLLARFISHKVTDVLLPAVRHSGTDWVMVRQGYGINQLRLAIERYLADHVEDMAR